MRNFDFTPYRRSTVGFDKLFDLLEGAREAANDGHPPFNLERRDEDRFRITLAVAGFKRDEIEIVSQQNQLFVRGNRPEGSEAGSQPIHIGIANRSFERRFELADFIKVEGAELSDGLLTIDLVREIPEAMMPRTIPIGTGTETAEAIEDHRHAA